MGYSMRSKTMVKRDISFSSALMKIVDDVQVNALDRVAHATHLKSFHNVKRSIDIGDDG
jgi:hypothetical protein